MILWVSVGNLAKTDDPGSNGRILFWCAGGNTNIKKEGKNKAVELVGKMKMYVIVHNNGKYSSPKHQEYLIYEIRLL